MIYLFQHEITICVLAPFWIGGIALKNQGLQFHPSDCMIQGPLCQASSFIAFFAPRVSEQVSQYFGFNATTFEGTPASTRTWSNKNVWAKGLWHGKYDICNWLIHQKKVGSLPNHWRHLRFRKSRQASLGQCTQHGGPHVELIDSCWKRFGFESTHFGFRLDGVPEVGSHAFLHHMQNSSKHQIKWMVLSLVTSL